MAGESIDIGRLAIPAVIALISFLSYTSQCLFWFLEPGPLTKSQAWRFNILVACIWISYYRACTVDPGRVPKDWAPKGNVESRSSQDQDKGGDDLSGRQRWCRKCSAFKPPRAHHCKICQRCIPRMDHHCPWTRNCVSHFTLPHFMRFLFYAVVSMIYLESFIFTRIGIVWEHRNMPSYLGPSIPALAHLFILLVVNSLTLFALIVLLIRSLWAIGGNVTTIESWEIERHKTLLRRAKYFGGYLDGPDGMKVLIRKQEFPYDVGILKNIRAAMGGSWNFLSWFWPLARTPDRNSGLEFEVNEFEDPGLSWPPPDPDRIPRKSRPIFTSADPFTIPHYDTAAEELAAFRQRQQNDTARRQMVMNNEDPRGIIRRRRKFHERFNKRPSSNKQSANDVVEDSDSMGSEAEDNQLIADANDHIEVDEGEEAWRNAEGERLDDFGVDEEVEFYDEEDVPLSVLKERIKAGL